MKAIVVDVSRNSSYKKVISFLSHHNDAEIIYTFDYLYNRYASIEEMLNIYKPRTIPLKAILERFSLKNTISMTSANDDYYDNDDDDDFLDIFKLSSFIIDRSFNTH